MSLLQAIACAIAVPGFGALAYGWWRWSHHEGACIVNDMFSERWASGGLLWMAVGIGLLLVAMIVGLLGMM
jgi:hypothetical protein